MATWSWRSSWQETGRGGLAMALRAKSAGGDGHSVVAGEEGEAGVEGLALGVPGDLAASWRCGGLLAMVEESRGQGRAEEREGGGGVVDQDPWQLRACWSRGGVSHPSRHDAAAEEHRVGRGGGRGGGRTSRGCPVLVEEVWAG